MNETADGPDRMRRRRLTRAQAKARTRELLVAAAAEVFAARGYEGASVEEIAESAGFSIGALYSNFAGKQELFTALMAQRASAQVAEATAILAEQPPGVHRQRALGQVIADEADKDGDSVVLQAEFWLYAVRNPEVLDDLAAQRRASAGELRALIAERLSPVTGGQAGTGSTELVEQLTTVVTALFEGLVRQRRIDPDSVAPEVFGKALRWLYRGVRSEVTGFGGFRAGGRGARPRPSTGGDGSPR